MSSKAKIYVADPDPGVVRFIRGALEQGNYTVQEAFDWSQMVDEMQVLGADMAFIAADIPDTDVGDIIRLIKRDEECAHVPVVLLCEAGDNKSVGYGLASGASDICYKPLVLADLRNKVLLHTSRTMADTATLELDDSAEKILDAAAGGRLPISDLQTGSERYDRDLTTFIEVTEAITSSLEPEDAFFVLVRRISDAIPCDRCNVVLRGSTETEAFVVASHDDPNLKHLEIDLSRYPEYVQALESAEPVLIDDAATHPVVEKVRSHVTKAQVGSTLVFPLIVREEAVGVLAMSTRGGVRDFEPAELLLLRATANLAACVVKATTALETLRYRAISDKAPAEDFDNIVLDLDDQIEIMMDELDQ